jgi:hypothetical protein
VYIYSLFSTGTSIIMHFGILVHYQRSHHGFSGELSNLCFSNKPLSLPTIGVS